MVLRETVLALGRILIQIFRNETTCVRGNRFADGLLGGVVCPNRQSSFRRSRF